MEFMDGFSSSLWENNNWHYTQIMKMDEGSSNSSSNLMKMAVQRIFSQLGNLFMIKVMHQMSERVEMQVLQISQLENQPLH